MSSYVLTFLNHQRCLNEIQTMAWGYLVEKYANTYELPSEFTVLELRYRGFILTLNGLMVHGGHFRNEAVDSPVFRLHVDSTFLLEEPKVWAAPGYGGVHDLREDRDLWLVSRFLPGARMSQGTYAVSFLLLIIE